MSCSATPRRPGWGPSARRSRASPSGAVCPLTNCRRWSSPSRAPGPSGTSQRSCRLASPRGEEVVFVYLVDRGHRASVPRVPRRVTVGCSSASTAGPSGWCSRRRRSERQGLHTSILAEYMAAPLAAGGRRRIPVVLPGPARVSTTAAPSVLAGRRGALRGGPPRLWCAPLLRRLPGVARAR